MSDSWSNTMQERSRTAIAESRYLSLNGKVIFKHIDGSRHFVYEAEIDKSLYRLRCMKNSHTFLEYDSLDELFHAGWILA